MFRRVLRAAGIAGIAALLMGACGQQGSSTKTDAGITDSTITIGATIPQSGPFAPAYSIAKGANAYFEYINAHGGVAGGRKIKFVVLDDQYSANLTPAAARELVEQDHVILTFSSFGTATNLAVREYYNQQKVPQVQVASGSVRWAQDYAKFPWTIGWQADYSSEAAIYARYIQESEPTDRIGVLYQNDDLGLGYLDGLNRGFGEHYTTFVKRSASYGVGDPTDMSSQVGQLKASGANTFFIVGSPPYAANAVGNAIRSGWNPRLVIATVVSTALLWKGVAKAFGSSAPLNGMLTTTLFKDPSDPSWASDKGVNLYNSVMSSYGTSLGSPGCSPGVNDVQCIAGLSEAYNLVEVLDRAYKDGQLTRKHVMDIECCSQHWSDNPMLLPGIVVYTSATDHNPIQELKLQKWQDTGWVAFGSVIDVRPGGTPN